MPNRSSHIFGNQSQFAIEIGLSSNAPSISFRSNSIKKEEAFCSATPFIADEFLSYLSASWGRLFLEQIYPFASEKTIFSPQHFVFVNKDDPQRACTVKSFEQAHNVGAWLDGTIGLYFMRQGQFIEVTWERKNFAFPLSYMYKLFTDFGNYLARNALHTSIERWNNRENIPRNDLITYASGIQDSGDVLRNYIEERVSFSFQDLIEDHPYLALARMAQSTNLSPDDANIAIKTIQTISRTKSTDIKSTPLPLWARNIPNTITDPIKKPYEQAYELADYLRTHVSEIDSSSGKINIYPLLTALGYEVFERDLPHKIHALCVWHGDTDQFVILNTSDKALGFRNNHLHRAAMAHELCHILLDKDRTRPLVDLALASQNDPAEKRARAFAAELLLPRANALHFISLRNDTRETVELLSWKYEVSLSITANQLRNGSTQMGKPLPPCISDYVEEIKARSIDYDAAEAKLINIIDEIRELKNLQPGWYEGSGNVPPADRLNWLIGNIEVSFHPQELIVPGIFPTPDGHVQLEWDLGKHQGILEFDLEKQTADWLMFMIDGSIINEEETIDLRHPSGWTNLANCITKLMDEAAND